LPVPNSTNDERVIQMQRWNAAITVAENWDAELKKNELKLGVIGYGVKTVGQSDKAKRGERDELKYLSTKTAGGQPPGKYPSVECRN
jgi:hypothetical protein